MRALRGCLPRLQLLLCQALHQSALHEVAAGVQIAVRAGSAHLLFEDCAAALHATEKRYKR